MVKKNLKNALRAHEARKVQASKVQAAEDAAKRKAFSVKAGKQSKKQRRASDQSGKTFVKPFHREDTILLVGEGNFSFAHSLLLPPHNHNPDLILATALDGEEECFEKYPDAKGHVEEMRRIAGRHSIVAFQVDAGKLDDCKLVRAGGSKQNGPAEWSKVVFNFPHVGAGHKDESRNVLSNQLMLLRFLVSVAPLLSQGVVPAYAANTRARRDGKTSEDEEGKGDGEDEEGNAGDGNVHDPASSASLDRRGFRTPPQAGSVLITLRNCKPYTLWDLPRLAKKLPLVHSAIASSAPSAGKGVKPPSAAQVDRLLSLGQGKAYRVWRSFQFSPELWPGYSHRRTIGWKAGRSTSDNQDISHSQEGENRTWELGLAD